MKNQTFLKLCRLFLLMIVISINSCNTSESDKPISKKDATPEIGTPMVTASLNGTLDTLWVDSLQFAKLKYNKIVFSFLLGQNNNITLSGWNAKGLTQSTYDSTPAITLSQGKAAPGVNFGSGTYFGNVLIKDINKIQKALKDSLVAPFVLFAPSINKRGLITYKILFGQELQTHISTNTKKSFIVTDPGFDANPTPPHDY